MKFTTKTILCITLLASSFGVAQVGINTMNPRTTLQIDSKNPENPDSSVGILIPRVSQNPTSGNENGQLIYNTNTNVFYFWDGTTWLPISQGANKDLNSFFADSRQDAAIEISNNSTETLVPGVAIEFSVDQAKPVQFQATVNFSGTSSAFAPLFKLKLTNLDTSTEEIIDQASNTFLSDGISSYFGNLPLMTIRQLPIGRYKVEVLAYYNSCCSFDFNYNVGGENTPVSVLIQY